MSTYPKVVFGDLTFEHGDILEAKLIEEFDPICATLPAGTFELTLYSPDADFSALNPYRSQSALISKQSLSVYENIDGVEHSMGLFFLDEWESADDTLVKFKCIDQIGLLETYQYDGGLWTSAVTVDDLLAEITQITGISFEIDPDVSGTTVKGWIPAGNCREAVQQIMFASGLIAITARQEGFINITKLISGSGVSTRGIVSGVAAVGQTRKWQKHWRPAQWALSTVGEITSSMMNATRPVIQRIGVTGVEVYAHNYIADTTTVNDLFSDTLPVGEHKITFTSPVHSLSVSGASTVESGANYVVVSVASPGTVTITGKPYIDSVKVYSQYMTALEMGDMKENIVTVEQAYLVNASNAAEVVSRVYDYYQIRFIQKCRLYAPIQIQAGSEVYVDTLYTQVLRGWIQKMSVDLSRGFTVDAEVVGDIEIPIYEIYSGIGATGESRTRQRSFRPSVGYW